MQDEENFDNYLIATIKLPIKVGIDGNLYTLNNYVNITIENMMDTPMKSTDSIHDKVVEYITSHPEYFKQRKCYFREIIAQEFDTQEFDAQEFDAQEFDVKTNANQTMLHSFPYFNRRKKPLNITFRAKGKSRSFTKKHYF